jgi:hypothetical protein
MRGLALLAATLLVALAVAPAQAKRKPPADPMAQICELNWQASFGKVELKQDWSGQGVMTRETLDIRREFPAGDGPGASLWLTSHSMLIDGKDHPSQSIYLGLAAPYAKGENQRLVIAIPGGDPLIIAASNGGSLVRVGDAQLTRLLEAKGRLSYRVIAVDRRGAEKKQLSVGWIDLSGFAGQPLAGLTDVAARARNAMAQARGGDNPPCALANAAEMNMMDSEEPTRKWLSFDCSEAWHGPLGRFELRENTFSWRPGSRNGVSATLAGSFRPAPNATLQQFLIAPGDPHRYGRISVLFGAQNWGANYRSTDPAQRERQSGELRRGKFAARHWLSQDGSTSFSWGEFAQLLAGEGDLEITAHDKDTGATLRGTLPWADVLAAEEQLRSGMARLTERERDPMARCKAVVDVELGMEEIIVT